MTAAVSSDNAYAAINLLIGKLDRMLRSRTGDARRRRVADDIRSHGRDERMRIKSFYDGQEFLMRLAKLLSSTRTVP